MRLKKKNRFECLLWLEIWEEAGKSVGTTKHVFNSSSMTIWMNKHENKAAEL